MASTAAPATAAPKLVTSAPSPPALKIPEYTLEPIDGGAGGYLLLISLPNVASSREVDLEINEAAVDCHVPHVYARLHVPLPEHACLDDTNAMASWQSKTRQLKVTLPRKS